MSEHELRHTKYFFAWGLVALLAVIGVSIALATIFIPRPVPTPGNYYFWPFFPFGGLFALFWIFAIFWFVRWVFGPWRWRYSGRYPGRYWRYHDESYYIIRERYAKGEITKEQFEQMMRDLEQHN